MQIPPYSESLLHCSNDGLDKIACTDTKFELRNWFVRDDTPLWHQYLCCELKKGMAYYEVEGSTRFTVLIPEICTRPLSLIMKLCPAYKGFIFEDDKFWNCLLSTHRNIPKNEKATHSNFCALNPALRQLCNLCCH